MIVTEMDKSQCVAVLGASKTARLACQNEGQPYVVPITYALEGNCLYSFSLIGQKISWMRANAKVCIQVDQLSEGREWRSVVGYGVYEELPDQVGWKVQRERAWSLLSREAGWWEPGGLKPTPRPAVAHLFYRIILGELTGRHAFPEVQHRDAPGI